MKIKITETFKFAINCRETISFKKGQEVTVNENGLTVDNLKRIIAIGNATVIGNIVRPVVELETAAITQEDLVTKAPEYYDIGIKAELEQYARDEFNFELDRRDTLKNMRIKLDNHIASLDSNNEGEK